MTVWQFMCCVAPHIKDKGKESRVDDILDDEDTWRELGIEGF